MEKVKFQELMQKVTADAFKEALGVAKPKYKGKSDEELAKIMGLSEYQYNHFIQKTLARSIAEKSTEKMIEILKNGDSIEVPHKFNIFLHTSKIRLNKQGLPALKLSIRTRQSLKKELNKE